MRIAVMGAGAVGCYYGGLLAWAGHAVRLIGRARHVEAVARHGLLLDSHELPDHLPLYLEYLAQLPEEEALGGLRDVAPILGLLSARLQQRESRYAVLFELLLKLANTQVDSQKVAEKIADEARDDTPQALDAVWEEEQVKFFADQGCGESEISAHQRRFAGAVAPQYLNISNGGQQ